MIESSVATCKHCGCTAANPCRLYSNDECGWLTSACNVCTKPSCMYAELAAKRETECKRKRDLAAVVMPIAQRWVVKVRKEKEARSRRSKRVARQQSRRAA